MLRRDLIVGTAVLPLAGPGLFRLLSMPASAQPRLSEEATPFSSFNVRQIARDLASRGFESYDDDLPEAFSDLGYDEYRSLRFNTERSLWADQQFRFNVQFFHRGFIYRTRVELFEVVEGKARRILYSPDLFQTGDREVPENADLGFSGFRLHAPLNRPDYLDEFAVFQGASYFRAIAKGQIYGISARGLALRTGDQAGEEFPAFRRFWIERPAADSNSVVVHALLDSESAAAAYRFTLRPGDTTVTDVEMSLYPRVDIEQAGIAPLTSMFFFDANDRQGVDDFRPGVHDSDGLSMWNGRGERLWRPLSNPETLQISQFVDSNPRAFGLMQRQRSYGEYEDLEARYELRPSLWVEPIGDWGEGSVSLIEIPTREEIHDNIVAFWRPKDTLSAGGEYNYTYRLHWGWDDPTMPTGARWAKTRVGAGGIEDSRLFVLDATGGRLAELTPETPVTPEISASAGRIENPVAHRNPETGGWRLSFLLLPEGAEAVELRGRLMLDNAPLSEVWTYRWTP